ncbi:MAG: 3-keto-disaccharide hydrolase [Verrucomicrobiia bacterium]|mgnify:FL=1|tara:strand:- start:10473 stop:11180 length:708 start_codon:yes stop_codon:yes gene_type:complete
MNTLCRLLVLKLLFALTLSWSAAAEAEFVSLFNGKDLTGWKSNEETPGCFSVVDGNLKVSGGRAHLFYTGNDDEPEIKNFVLKLKVKTQPGANSGVYFHTQYQAEGWPSVGFESQVNSTHSDPKKTGSLYGVVNVLALAEGKSVPPGSLENHLVDKAPSTDGEWFNYNIRVNNRKITIRVNGEITAQWTQPKNFDPKKALKNNPGRKLGAGTFALQAHDPKSTTFYKDIMLKILP